ncbi:F6'H2 [Symbiodinium natans]|uniref:F6'H2 protein n=1 Tax=Symbiodinium natans TaxID=878477 RepID=A0A812RMH8_9DINO|nr:F6'H2 [Symbiodinium natans]
MSTAPPAECSWRTRPSPVRGNAIPTTVGCARRCGWKRCRLTWSTQRSRFLPSTPPPCLRMHGSCSENPKWALEALKAKGYVIVQFTPEEQACLNDLYRCSREFFSNPSRYKEGFKFFPIPGGYLTPFPGTYEVFELRRGLPSCPAELRQAMEAFALLEKVAIDFSAEIGHDVGLDLHRMPNDTSSTMRCIHYDRPLESRGATDLPQVAIPSIAVGAEVRLVNLQGGEATLNGCKGVVAGMDKDDFQVSLAGAPEAVLSARGTRSIVVRQDKLRLLRPDAPGMYPAHTDSSLITVAPKSSAPGLEVKDLQTGEWFNIEDMLQVGEALLFVGDPLDYASGHRYPALMHRPAVCRAGSAPAAEHRISTPFFLYPRSDAVLAPSWLPRLVFEDLNGNVNKCRDRFPWKKHTCYYSDLVYSEQKD